MLPQANLKEVVKNKIICVLYNTKMSTPEGLGGRGCLSPVQFLIVLVGVLQWEASQRLS